MDLLQLKYFQVVAECQHMTHAAEKLHIAQPSLSQAIAKLENELGVSLFERKGRTILLNTYGDSLLRSVNIILRTVEDIRTEFDDLKETFEKQVSVATTDNMYLLGWLNLFVGKHEGIKVLQKVLPLQQILKDLQSGIIDFAIMPSFNQCKGLEYYRLYEDEYYVLLNRKHPRARKESMNMDEIAKEPIIAAYPTSSKQRIVDELYALTGIPSKIIFEGPTDMICEMLEMNKGISFGSKSMLRWIYGLRTESLTTLKINEPYFRRDVNLYWIKKSHMKEASSKFKNFVINFHERNPIDSFLLDNHNFEKREFNNLVVD